MYLTSSAGVEETRFVSSSVLKGLTSYVIQKCFKVYCLIWRQKQQRTRNNNMAYAKKRNIPYFKGHLKVELTQLTQSWSRWNKYTNVSRIFESYHFFSPPQQVSNSKFLQAFLKSSDNCKLRYLEFLKEKKLN